MNPAKKISTSERDCERLQQVFARAKAFVLRRGGGYKAVDVSLRACPEIRRGLRSAARQRAYMHTGHIKQYICTHPDAAKLSDGFLFGVLFHEFGHVFTGAGEAKADQWVFEKLGLPLRYKGAKKLEWIDPKILELKGI